MSIAIVILNWNGEKYLRTFLPTLINCTKTPNTEIIVADNASTDNSVAELRLNFPNVGIIELSENFGFAGGYNKALKQVQADYYVLLNSDIEVTDGWLEPLVNYMEENDDAVACQPKILAYNQKTHFEHAGASGGYIDFLGFPFCRGRIFNHVEPDMGQYNSIEEIFWASGACLFVRAENYWQVGGLDEYFFAHMEEIDLCWRLKNRGGRIVVIPQSVVYHIGGGTLNTESPFKTFLNFRNNLIMLYKNLPENQLRKVLFYRFILDYLAAIQLFVSGKPQNAMSVLKARNAFHNVKSKYKAIRIENRSFTTVENHVQMFNKSIVAQFYLYKKRCFSDIFDIK